LAGLHSRAEVELDETGNVIYTVQVPEFAQEPDYQSALKSLYMAEERLVINRIKSFKFALRGAWMILIRKYSLHVQFSIGVLMTIAWFVVGITPTEWMFQCLAIGLVLSIEGLNTAVEKLADFIHPDFHHKIGFIKDIAAGAVCFAAVIAVIVGLIIYVPYLSEW